MTVGLNDDYAYLEVDSNNSFYYGYEKTVGLEKEWAFSAKINGVEDDYVISTSELIARTGRENEEPAFYLMAGMALVLAQVFDEFF